MQVFKDSGVCGAKSVGFSANWLIKNATEAGQEGAKFAETILIGSLVESSLFQKFKLIIGYSHLKEVMVTSEAKLLCLRPIGMR